MIGLKQHLAAATVSALLLGSTGSMAQPVISGKPTVIALDTLKGLRDANIVSLLLAGDSLSTSFFISVRDSVPMHYHAWHSEHIYVLSGWGVFTLDSEELDLMPGTYIFVPKGTPHAVRIVGAEPLRAISIQTPHFDGSDRISVR